MILIRLKLKRGDGKLVVSSPQVRSRKRRASFPQSPPQIIPQIAVEASTSMSHEGGAGNMSDEENTFIKYFFGMNEMVKFFYEQRNSRL